MKSSWLLCTIPFFFLSLSSSLCCNGAMAPQPKATHAVCDGRLQGIAFVLALVGRGGMPLQTVELSQCPHHLPTRRSLSPQMLELLLSLKCSLSLLPPSSFIWMQGRRAQRLRCSQRRKTTQIH
mmetsp:Transcript_67727/g.147525  ORF Transcript_67727/g.147525 Transcript_67727/m.147525 type:complete len:124 (+) Transcript_67727:146-517(+)